LVPVDGFQMPVLRQAAARWWQLRTNAKARDRLKTSADQFLFSTVLPNTVFIGVKLADKI